MVRIMEKLSAGADLQEVKDQTNVTAIKSVKVPINIHEFKLISKGCAAQFGCFPKC